MQINLTYDTASFGRSGQVSRFAPPPDPAEPSVNVSRPAKTIRSPRDVGADTRMRSRRFPGVSKRGVRVVCGNYDFFSLSGQRDTPRVRVFGARTPPREAKRCRRHSAGLPPCAI